MLTVHLTPQPQFGILISSKYQLTIQEFEAQIRGTSETIYVYCFRIQLYILDVNLSMIIRDIPIVHKGGNRNVYIFHKSRYPHAHDREGDSAFKERGTEHVSVKDICDEAGVTRNAFYYHFESKDLLFDAIGDYVSMVSKSE